LHRWQKLRSSELKFEKESKENQLSNLTLKEREVRKRIEDILSPQDSALDPLTQSPKLTINKSLTNGVSGAKANEPGGKRSKKKHN
jgi:COMPASS component SPP1